MPRKQTRRQRKQRKQQKTRKYRKQHKTRKYGRRGGAIHPGATVVLKPDDYSPFIMASPEVAEELFETRNVYKL